MAVTGDEGNYLTVNSSSVYNCDDHVFITAMIIAQLSSSIILPGDNGMVLGEVFPGF